MVEEINKLESATGFEESSTNSLRVSEQLAQAQAALFNNVHP